MLAREQVPGAALVLVQRGRADTLVALGHRGASPASGAVDADTLFRVGSISKSFTGLALALLVQDGRVALDDPVVRWLPALHWPREVTLAHLLAHRSGYALDPFELLLWPQPNRYTGADLVAAAAAAARVAPPGERFAYSNVGYALAGEVIAKAAGMPLPQWVAQQVFGPLGMACRYGGYRAGPASNIATPHVGRGAAVVAVRADRGRVPVGLDAAAGGARCSARGLARWLHALADASAAPTPRLRSALALAARPAGEAGATHYGLGLEVSGTGDATMLSHDGGVAGMLARVRAWPAEGAALGVLLNRSAPAARNELAALLQAALPVPAPAPVVAPAPPAAPPPPSASALTALTALTTLPAAQAARLAGRYTAGWLGPVSLCPERGALVLRVARSPLMVADLRAEAASGQPLVFWRDAAVNSDSRWLPAAGGSYTLAPIAASDFDFSALRFERVGACARQPR